jgi:hypothetical protein
MHRRSGLHFDHLFEAAKVRDAQAGDASVWVGTIRFDTVSPRSVVAR